MVHRSTGMVASLLPIGVLLMLAFMFVRVAVMLRRDRIRTERDRTRGKHAFTPKHRARFLLDRAFPPSADEPTSRQLLAALEQVPARPANDGHRTQ